VLLLWASYYNRRFVMELIEKNAVVTCACSGLGHAIASELIHAGASVTINDSDESHAIDVVGDLQGMSNDMIQRCNILEMNISKVSVDQVISESYLKNNDGVDILVNIIGCENNTSSPEETVEVNLDRLMKINRAFIPIMNHSNGEKIINVAVGEEYEKVVVAATRELAEELADQGINVNCICVDKSDSEKINKEVANIARLLSGPVSNHISGDVLHLSKL
jgi:NAD(P)-dependent dehydrogenase (short-subunit alcohol dehydrogenase family)